MFAVLADLCVQTADSESATLEIFMNIAGSFDPGSVIQVKKEAMMWISHELKDNNTVNMRMESRSVSFLCCVLHK